MHDIESSQLSSKADCQGKKISPAHIKISEAAVDMILTGVIQDMYRLSISLRRFVAFPRESTSVQMLRNFLRAKMATLKEKNPGNNQA